MNLHDLPPGAVLHGSEPVEINAGLPVIQLRVTNTSNLPVHLTAHLHVFEANPCLRFDRRRAFGMRPDLPAGGAVRVNPGETVSIDLVPVGGARIVRGFSGLINGPLDEIDIDDALSLAIERSFLHQPEDEA